MLRSRRQDLWVVGVWLLAGGSLLAVCPAMAAADEQRLLLDVRINGYAIGLIGDFVWRDAQLFSKRSELIALGLRPPELAADETQESQEWVGLSSLQHLQWRVDWARQILLLTAQDQALLPTQLGIVPAPRHPAAVDSGTGATLNYDLNATATAAAAARRSATGWLDLRAFSPLGVVSTGALVYAGARDQALPATVRLDTTYTHSNPVTQRRLRVGDFVTGSLAWTRPVRLGGVQLTSDFSMRPDLVTFPLPQVSGSAAVPSTLDVLINGNRYMTREVGAGPFEIGQLPVVTGAGTIALTLTNALGRQVLTTLPFYASADLLAPGLQTYSIQLGAVRRHWGQLANDYGPAAASLSVRHAHSPELTLEGHAEAMRSVHVAGLGAVVIVANQALLNLSGAVSQQSGDQGRRGARMAAGLQRIGKGLSVSVTASASSPGFRDIAATQGDTLARRQLGASAGWSLGRWGSVGLALAMLRRDSALLAAAPSGAFDAQPAANSRVLSASYAVQWRDISFYVTAYQDRAPGGNRGTMMGMTVPLGARTSASASLSASKGADSRQVQMQQSAADVGDWGYQVYAVEGMATHQFVQAQYKSPVALLQFGLDRLGQQSTVALQAAGSLSVLDGHWFAGNTISDSFAVVDTHGLPGVRVLHENRLAGRTDAAGRLLVTELRAFDVNYLAVDPNDIPLDSTLNVAEREVRPQDRSGVTVRFPVKVSHGALLRMTDSAGVALPVGAVATLLTTGARYPVGYGGEVYVEGLGARNELSVDIEAGLSCALVFPYQPVAGEIPTIGPLICQPEEIVP